MRGIAGFVQKVYLVPFDKSLISSCYDTLLQTL